jgi:hypothetical protein
MGCGSDHDKPRIVLDTAQKERMARLLNALKPRAQNSRISNHLLRGGPRNWLRGSRGHQREFLEQELSGQLAGIRGGVILRSDFDDIRADYILAAQCAQ